MCSIKLKPQSIKHNHAHKKGVSCEKYLYKSINTCAFFGFNIYSVEHPNVFVLFLLHVFISMFSFWFFILINSLLCVWMNQLPVFFYVGQGLAHGHIYTWNFAFAFFCYLMVFIFIFVVCYFMLLSVGFFFLLILG